jgi:hypothetical protein
MHTVNAAPMGWQAQQAPQCDPHYRSVNRLPAALRAASVQHNDPMHEHARCNFAALKDTDSHKVVQYERRHYAKLPAAGSKCSSSATVQLIRVAARHAAVLLSWRSAA